jgi:hypothetical protein
MRLVHRPFLPALTARTALTAPSVLWLTPSQASRASRARERAAVMGRRFGASGVVCVVGVSVAVVSWTLSVLDVLSVGP